MAGAVEGAGEDDVGPAQGHIAGATVHFDIAEVQRALVGLQGDALGAADFAGQGGAGVLDAASRY